MTGDARSYRVLIIGAGLSGICAASTLLRAGIDDFVVLDKGDDVGGTWRDNTYPGCACDVPSALYSFSWAPNKHWSRLFAPQQEIQQYVRDVADRHDVRSRVRLRTEVTGASWDDDRSRWVVDTNDGEFQAQVIIACPGPWHEPSIPELPGLESFTGETFHSSRWDHAADLTGKRVAVVGSGASAVQFVPAIQPRVGKLLLFQRTPHWVLPKIDWEFGRIGRAMMRMPIAHKALRGAVYAVFEALNTSMRHPRLMRQLQRVAELHLRATVEDRNLRASLTPSFLLGCKRVLMSNDYYQSLTRPNVDVIPMGVTAVSARSVTDSAGTEHEVDAIVFGTGFKMLDMPVAGLVRGRNGDTLADVWRGSPRGYLGTTSAGFPNAFLLLGPNLGINTAATVLMEAQMRYILDAVRTIEREGIDRIEVVPEVQDSFNAWVDENLAGTVWNDGGCSSYYLDSTGRNGFMYPRSATHLRRRLRRFDRESYLIRRPAPTTPRSGERVTA